MVSEYELLVKCLDIAKHLVNNSMFTTMTIKVGKEFFDFTNIELIKKICSTSQIRRNLERHEHFSKNKINKKVEKGFKATIDQRCCCEDY